MDFQRPDVPKRAIVARTFVRGNIPDIMPSTWSEIAALIPHSTPDRALRSHRPKKKWCLGDAAMIGPIASVLVISGRNRPPRVKQSFQLGISIPELPVEAASHSNKGWPNINDVDPFGRALPFTKPGSENGPQFLR